METNPPDWYGQVNRHLLWAVHVATQHVPDAATRNRVITGLLRDLLARW